MTFKDLYTIALERVDEDTDTTDTIILGVIKDGVNKGYALVATLLDKTITTSTSIAYAKTITLPTDCFSVEHIDHDNLGRFSKSEYVAKDGICDFKTMNISGGNVTVTYVKYPAKLSADTDTVVLKDSYASIPAIYGAYEYMLHKRKYSACQLLLEEFNSYLPQQINK